MSTNLTSKDHFTAHFIVSVHNKFKLERTKYNYTISIRQYLRYTLSINENGLFCPLRTVLIIYF